MVTLIGAEGSMGRRYQAILAYIGHPHICVDDPCPDEAFQFACEQSDHIIIATPTDTHEAVINRVLASRKAPCFILCEKPILKASAEKVGELYALVGWHGSKLYCVNQYQFLALDNCVNGAMTTYDYYNTGRDGLHWDCFQLYALASDKVIVKNKSPLWKCTINGIAQSSRAMDRAYVDMVHNFLGDKSKMWDRETVVKATQRVIEAMK